MKSIVRAVAVSSLSAALFLAPTIRAQDDQQTRVIAVQYKVFDSSNRQRGGTAGLDESASVRVGESIRLELVGTALIGGIGKEVAIDADFSVAAGRGNIQLGRTGDNWVIVTVRDNSGDGSAQVGFEVTGDFDMHGRNTSGRITLDIDGNGGSGGSNDEESDTSSGSSAADLTSALYRGILNERSSGQGQREDQQRIRDEGYSAAVEIASGLAQEAEDQGLGRSERGRGYESEDMRRVGNLYRSLLKREGSDQELWGADRGFVGNVRALHERGLTAVVDSIVSSDEFQQVWGFRRQRAR